MQRNHKREILAIVIVALFIGVGIHPAFALDTNQSMVNKTSEEECCNCKEIDNRHLVRLKKQLNRLEVYTNLFLVLSKHNPELKEKIEELLGEIKTLKEELADIPICVILEYIDKILEDLYWSFRELSYYFYFFPIICYQIVHTIRFNIFFIGFLLSCWEWEWPPNDPPVISNENPSDGATDVPLFLHELSFVISDKEWDYIDYSVTTNPDIGSEVGFHVKPGLKRVSIAGLKPNTTYEWTVEVSDDQETTVKQYSFFTVTPFDPFDGGWQYRKKVTIDHNLVDGYHSDFPVLVNIVDSDLRNKTQDDGDDILFMDGSGSAYKLYHEIEYFDSSSGELVTWVRIPNLSCLKDTIFYMYYGNPNCGNQQSSEHVWDENYCAVWHLDTIYDSTSNNNHGNNYGSNTSWEHGKLGMGIEITNEGMIRNISPLDNSITKELTIDFWINWYGRDTSWPAPSYVFDCSGWGDERGMLLYIQEDGHIYFCTFYKNGLQNITSSSVMPKNIWTHISVIYHYGIHDLSIFINGLEDNSTTANHLYLFSTYSAAIGNNRRGPVNESYRPLNGIIDEFRISDKYRYSGWIKTQYNNQNDPLIFMSFGPEETEP